MRFLHAGGNDMMSKVECMAADAAADEQRAMRDLAGISGPDIMQLQDVMGQAFKNSKVLGKGRAHPAQRMLSRPLAADPQLKEIADEFVEKPQSVARLVANSHNIKDLYSDFRKNQMRRWSSARASEI